MVDLATITVVNCSFLCGVQRSGVSVEQRDVKITRGLSPWRLRLRSAAHTTAIEGFSICRMWAMPHLVPAAPGDWLVYEHNVGAEQAPVFLHRLPTRDAAEMWMLHHAE